MAHKIDLVMDFQYGSTGKGAIAGYLAKRGDYDTAVCSFGTQAGHTYIDKSRDLHTMVQQLPTSITSPTVRQVLIGPGAIISAQVLKDELSRYREFMQSKRLLIHPHAAVVDSHHAEFEVQDGRTKMGSTAKGVGEALIERIRRGPNANIVANRFIHDPVLRQYIASKYEWVQATQESENMIVEGAQGFSLSLYHGQYPFVTSRDVTPWQIMADCGLPFRMASTVRVIGSIRTLPIRVNNRDGSSGPCYPDQRELSWEEVGVAPELTTVTKLPRRIFSFSYEQLREALWHCGEYWNTWIFLNFANYISRASLDEMIKKIQAPSYPNFNPPTVAWIGHGPDDSDIEEVERNDVY